MSPIVSPLMRMWVYWSDRFRTKKEFRSRSSSIMSLEVTGDVWGILSCTKILCIALSSRDPNRQTLLRTMQKVDVLLIQMGVGETCQSGKAGSQGRPREALDQPRRGEYTDDWRCHWNDKLVSEICCGLYCDWDTVYRTGRTKIQSTIEDDRQTSPKSRTGELILETMNRMYVLAYRRRLTACTRFCAATW